MAPENNSELPIRHPDPYNKGDEKKAKRTRKNTKRKAAQRKRDADNAIEIYIPIKCEPAKHLLYIPPRNTVGRLFVHYLGSLQKMISLLDPVLGQIYFLIHHYERSMV